MAQSVMSYPAYQPMPDFLQWMMVLLFCVAAGSSGLSYAADPLKDPTRPPNLSNKEGKSDGGDDHGEDNLVLQSVLIAPKRQVAIINGQAVEKNGRIGAYTLAQLSETEAVLHRTNISKKQKTESETDVDRAGGKQRITLKLFPDFEKKRLVKNNNE